MCVHCLPHLFYFVTTKEEEKEGWRWSNNNIIMIIMVMICSPFPFLPYSKVLSPFPSTFPLFRKSSFKDEGSYQFTDSESRENTILMFSFHHLLQKEKKIADQKPFLLRRSSTNWVSNLHAKWLKVAAAAPFKPFPLFSSFLPSQARTSLHFHCISYPHLLLALKLLFWSFLLFHDQLKASAWRGFE